MNTPRAAWASRLYPCFMSDLWAQRRQQAVAKAAPLAARMRPRTLDEFVGQEHILGRGRLLRRMLAADVLTSLILHGPPGTGKTTLAEVIAAASRRHFERENAASVGVARIRQIIEEATARLERTGQRTVLFLDEIHRFSRAQQDVLLADVERGVVTLIGATTENPLFSVNSALVSRSTLLRLEALAAEDIKTVLRRAIADAERGYGALNVKVDEDALEVWAVKSDGDARRALGALEVAVLSSTMRPEVQHVRTDQSVQSARLVDGSADQRVVGLEGGPGGASADLRGGQEVRPSDAAAEAGEGAGAQSHRSALIITRADAEDSIQQKAAVYNGTGDEHYDTISAFIKSVRGSDPDAAMYWLARMLDAGEDPRFIARRLAILASEDIGNADPRGIMVAASCWELVERIGMPEARITLAQCTTYLALAPKSNASYTAIDAALADVKQGRTVAVPAHIKDGNVRKATQKSAGSGKTGEAYAYSHERGADSAALGKIGTQDYLGVDKRYYQPTDHGFEAQLKQRLDEARRARGRDQ